MKTEIQVFNHELFGQIRVLQDENNEPWFVGKDVANILGYSNTRDALLKRVDNEDKTDGVAICDSIGREQKPIIINESGLYSLILSSKLPNAKKFKRWVTSVVLPQIRKTGGYIPVEAEDDDMTILCKAVKILNRTVEEKESIIKTLIPKAEFADQISAGGNHNSCHSKRAKVSREGASSFCKCLRTIFDAELVRSVAAISSTEGSQKVLPSSNVPTLRTRNIRSEKSLKLSSAGCEHKPKKITNVSSTNIL